MPKLFCVMLGGRAERCNIELHDIVFVVGNSLEDTYPQLIKKWFGIPNRIHIDASVELKYIDGYEITLSSEKSESKQKLYFVNFGAYRPGYFGELHQINFYVATSKTEALARAKKELCTEFDDAHCDDNIEVDDIFELNEIDHHYVKLQPTDRPHTLEVHAAYKKFM